MDRRFPPSPTPSKLRMHHIQPHSLLSRSPPNHRLPSHQPRLEHAGLRELGLIIRVGRIWVVIRLGLLEDGEN